MQDDVSGAAIPSIVVVKFATNKDGSKMRTYKREKDIDRVVKYVCKDKGSGKISLDYVGGNGVSVIDYKKAIRDIKRFQKKMGKETGRRLYHLIISFAYEKNPQIVYEVVERICDSFFFNYQYIFNVHTDSGNLHAHICIGSVGIRAPHKKIHFSKKEGAALLGEIKDLAIELLNPDFRLGYYDGFC